MKGIGVREPGMMSPTATTVIASVVSGGIIGDIRGSEGAGVAGASMANAAPHPVNAPAKATILSPCVMTASTRLRRAFKNK
jgi:hypothetical protein